jgi:hypothetical protein
MVISAVRFSALDRTSRIILNKFGLQELSLAGVRSKYFDILNESICFYYDDLQVRR